MSLLWKTATEQPTHVSHEELGQMYSGDYDVPMTQHLREATKDWKDGLESPHGGWNAHGSPRGHVDFLKKDIAENGMKEPLTIRGGNVVTDGHHRGIAAMELKMDKIPVRHIR